VLVVAEWSDYRETLRSIGPVLRRDQARRWGDQRQAEARFRILEFGGPRPALARLLQRSPGIDLKAALLQASDNFLAADADTIANHVEQHQTLYVRAGPGLLLCQTIQYSRSKTP
jgi:hypothetical protein